MCYFSVIYYEHIFPFIRGFANSSESQNLTAASRRAAAPLLPSLPPRCHARGGPSGVSPGPGCPPGQEDVFREPGITPGSFTGRGHLRREIRFKCWWWVMCQSKEELQQDQSAPVCTAQRPGGLLG